MQYDKNKQKTGRADGGRGIPGVSVCMRSFFSLGAVGLRAHKVLASVLQKRILFIWCWLLTMGT
jgi:hypothetical protein